MGFTTTQIAKHFREIHFGGNWTTSNIKDQLSDVTWQEANIKIQNLNTIAALTFHVNYYVDAVGKVLEGGPLVAKDKVSYHYPPITSQADWESMVNKALTDAEKFASLLEKMPDSKMEEIFIDPKYGVYFRHMIGIIEHTHYHLGQIAIIKKLIRYKEEEL